MKTEPSASKVLTLQVNSTGAWRNVVAFPAEQRVLVLRGLAVLVKVMGPTVKWCLLRDDKTREWLSPDMPDLELVEFGWKWVHGGEAGQLGMWQDVVEYRHDFPGMRFWPIYKLAELHESDFPSILPLES